MLYLVDTGALLRLFNRAHPQRRTIRAALFQLRRRGHRFAVSIQTVAEFWNVATRPAEARGGFGLSVEEADQQLRFIERHCLVLPETPNTYSVWREIVSRYQVKGVKVHDARLVAWMISHAIDHVVTLNTSDFARYSEITASDPAAILSSNPQDS